MSLASANLDKGVSVFSRSIIVTPFREFTLISCPTNSNATLSAIIKLSYFLLKMYEENLPSRVAYVRYGIVEAVAHSSSQNMVRH